MPILYVIQPDIIPIHESLRLRKDDGNHDFALPWYQDSYTCWMCDHDDTPYTKEHLERMYSYLANHGELYFIEIKKSDFWIPIGDVTFSQNDMPIVIGDSSFRGQGIGAQVIAALVERGRQLGYHELYVGEIYHDNIASQHVFEKAGFMKHKETKQGYSYRLDLRQE